MPSLLALARIIISCYAAWFVVHGAVLSTHQHNTHNLSTSGSALLSWPADHSLTDAVLAPCSFVVPLSLSFLNPNPVNPNKTLTTHQTLTLQQIQEDMEDGLDKKGDNKDFEEKLAEQLFADESTAKIQVCMNKKQTRRLAWVCVLCGLCAHVVCQCVVEGSCMGFCALCCCHVAQHMSICSAVFCRSV